jgi:hypothetical protein
MLFLLPLAAAVLAAITLAVLGAHQADIAALLLQAGPWQR